MQESFINGKKASNTYSIQDHGRQINFLLASMIIFLALHGEVQMLTKQSS